jgi:hypothetical protein
MHTMGNEKTGRKVAVTMILLALVSAGAASAANSLNIYLTQMNDEGSGTVFNARLITNKDGATSAGLTTPAGEYPLMNLGSYWYPVPSGSFAEDHSVLPWDQMAALIAEEWLLVWDEGLATETTASIGFGSVPEAEFPPVPVITYPVAGADYPEGVSRVVWNFGGADPCASPAGELRVLVYEGAGGYQESFGPLACTDTTVTLAMPSFGTHHFVVVDDQINVRMTADGIGGPVSGDPWVLGNAYWLSLGSRHQLEFTGPIVDVEGLSFGSLKATFR